MKGDYLLSQEVPCALVISAIMRCENSDNVCGPVCKMLMQRHKFRKAQDVVISWEPVGHAEGAVVQSE